MSQKSSSGSARQTAMMEAYFRSVGYEPHREQWAYHRSKARFRVVTAGRRFGKSTMCARDTAVKQCLKPNRRTWIVGPIYTLAEKEFRVIWNDLIVKKGFGKDKRVRKAYNVRSGEMFIHFPWNTQVECRSADHPDMLVGESLDHVIMSEAAKHKKETWDRFIRPSLADRHGSADFVSTPEGQNWFYDLWLLGRDPKFPAYESLKFPAWFNDAVYPKGRKDPEILLLEQTMDPEWFKQEIGADFASFAGKIFPEWDENVHVRPHKFRPDWKNYIAFDWGYCVDEETEILTRQGWKRHTDLRDGDMVLTQSPRHGLSEWQPVESVHRFEGTFDMRLMEHSQHSSFSTSNHRWLVCDGSGKNFRFKETDQLTKTDVITSGAPCLDLPKVAKYSDAFVELVAWYWTEGSYNGVLPERIWQNKLDGVYRIVKCLTDLCGPAKDSLRNLKSPAWRQDVHPGTGGQVFRFNRFIGAKLQQVCPGYGKIVTSDFITSLTEAQLRLFVDASLMADGYTTNGGSRRITQDHEAGGKRLEIFQMALQLLGTASVLRYDEKYDRWSLQLLVMSHLHPKCSGVGDRTTRVAYTGTVWCPKTPNGTWLARRKGTTYFTGNTNPLAAVEFQVSPSDQIFIWRVYYKKYKTVPDVASELLARANPDGYHLDLCFGDPADPEACEMMSRELGVFVWAPKDLKTQFTWLDGIMLLRQFQKQDREISRDEYGTPLYDPSFFIDPGCPEAIKEFSNYRSKAPIKGQNVPELGQKIEDHTVDAMRYALLCIFKLGAVYSLADIYGTNIAPSVPELSREAAELRALQASTAGANIAHAGFSGDDFTEMETYLGEETGTFTFDMDF